jgi:hypothetical protein
MKGTDASTDLWKSIKALDGCYSIQLSQDVRALMVVVKVL